MTGLAALSFTLVVGCNPSAETTSDSATETTQERMTRTESAVGDARQDLEAYTYEQRTQFIASMETELEAINESIDELALRIERSGAEAKAAATPRLNELRNEARLLQNRLDEVKEATDSNWNTVKASTRETYDNLKQNLAGARQWLSDTIEP
jgi:prefoldin subunit 5